MQTPSLVDLASRYWDSMALNAGVQLNLFAEVAQKKQSLKDLNHALDCSPIHLEALVNALTGLGLLEQKDGLIGLAPSVQPLLDPASPDCMLPALQFNADLAGLWMKLPDCIRSGKPPISGNPHLGEDKARTRRFVEGMHSRAGVMARGLLPVLHPPAGAAILDVGAGPCTFSLKLAERDPSLNITVLDLPPILEAAQDIHKDHPALSQITFLPGSYHETPFPVDQDWILYCGALHQEPDAAADALFPKLKAALKPGGKLVVVDLMLDADRTTPTYSALFEINMMLMRPTSRVHSSDELANRLTNLGFQSPIVSDIPGTPYRMVEAEIESHHI